MEGWRTLVAKRLLVQATAAGHHRCGIKCCLQPPACSDICYQYYEHARWLPTYHPLPNVPDWLPLTPLYRILPDCETILPTSTSTTSSMRHLSRG